MPTRVIRGQEEADPEPTTDPRTIVRAVQRICDPPFSYNDEKEAVSYVRRCLRLARAAGRREGARRVAKEVAQAVGGVPGSYEEPRMTLADRSTEVDPTCALCEFNEPHEH